MKILSLSLLLFLIVGCGSNSNVKENIDKKEELHKETIQNMSIKDNYANFIVAKNNIVRESKYSSGDYILKAYTDQTIGSDNPSQNVYQVYGKINSENFVLNLNANYPTGTKVVVKVFSKDGKLLKVGDIKKLAGVDQPVNMGNLILK
ncbi:MAG: hypothetical protein DSZ06_02665 [Sulfurospirillum sp.]|nr:MAG: hypothetical protein DSZ06_02665 [Sulfurospirillum sp.]